MERIEYKEGIISVGGIEVEERVRNHLLTLSALCGMSIEETCDRINQVMQAFCNTADSLKEIMKKLSEVETEDICESCLCSRRTRHGSSRAVKSRKSKYFMKWWEKYRPP